VPTVLHQLMKDADRRRAKRAIEAMLKMKKRYIAQLERASAGSKAPKEAVTID
jgi:hypothetical protein